MTSVIITAVLAFVSTNIDDMIVLMILYAGTTTTKEHIKITAGQYIGLALLTAAGMLGAAGMGLLPRQYTKLLGIIPVALGIKDWLDYKKTQKKTNQIYPDTAGKTAGFSCSSLFSIIIVTIADGGDNLGVYIPLFTGSSSSSLILTAAVFAVLAALLCTAAWLLADFSPVKSTIKRYQHYIVPAVFISIGMAVLIR